MAWISRHVVAAPEPPSSEDPDPRSPLESWSGPEVRLDLEVRPGAAMAPNLVHGTMHIRNWAPKGGYCVYLPFEDPDFGEDRGTARRFEMLSAKSGRLAFEGGSLAVRVAPPAVARLSEPRHIEFLDLPPGWTSGDELVLRFDATIPRLAKSNATNWFYDGFMPELLGACPPAGLDPAYYRRPVAAALTATIKIPPGWEYAGPGQRQADGSISAALHGRSLAFALGQGYQRLTFKAGAVDVTMLYRTPAFAELQQTVIETLPTMERVLGPYPFPGLTIVETSELQRHGLPGIIAMNKPHQTVFNHLQRSWLNWHHWIFTLQLARQWYGGAVAAATADDDWLIAGIAEFATLEALSRIPDRYNLFNPLSGGLRLLSFDYLQVSEMTASTLQRYAPFAALTTPTFTSRDPVNLQHPLLFIKNTFALRQLKGFAGEAAFFGFLRNVTSQHLFGELTPAAFRTYLGRLPSPFPPPVRAELATFLSRWWVDEGWPDFALTGFASEPLPHGQWVSRLTGEQEGQIDFPPLFGVLDESGREFVARADAATAGAGWQATIVTPYRPLEATVDPTHEAFDEDRFNNRSGGPELNFFPGNASTLADDAYTVLWLPYPFRRPGEPFSVGIQAGLFRYLQDTLLARFEAAPQGHLGAFDINHKYRLSRFALSGEMDVNQNYDNDRLIEVSGRRSPLLVGNPELSLELRLRRKERMGQPETAHGTVVTGLGIRPPGLMRTCTYSLLAQYEKAPLQLAHGFSYDRSLGVATGDCNLSPRVSLGLRGFRGALKGTGVVPDAALFKATDLREARLLLTQQQPLVRNIVSLGSDLLLPFYLPLPNDTLILSRQMRWRLFYDWGHALDTGDDYRSAGFGFLLPFGGDLAGAGSLALTRLSVLAIVYDNVNGLVKRRPSLVFDLTGEL